MKSIIYFNVCNDFQELILFIEHLRRLYSEMCVIAEIRIIIKTQAFKAFKYILFKNIKLNHYFTKVQIQFSYRSFYWW